MLPAILVDKGIRLADRRELQPGLKQTQATDLCLLVYFDNVQRINP